MSNTKNASNGTQKKKGLISSLYNSSSKEPIVLTEKDLLEKSKRDGFISPDDVLKLNKSTEGFLCKQTDNIYEIDFTKFKLRDMDTNTLLFEVCKPESAQKKFDDTNNDNRFVRYNFDSEFLKLRNIGATVEFTVGDKPVKNFFMIERHYFGDKLLKSFDFNFGFCVPNSRNTIEQIYEFPQLSDNLSNYFLIFMFKQIELKLIYNLSSRRND